jgi:hypothetical protein
MNQAQSSTTRDRCAGRWWSRDLAVRSGPQQTGERLDAAPAAAGRPNSWLWGEMLVTLITALWFVVSLPFRLFFWTVAWLGRLTAAVLGFTLMVVGMALWASPLFFIGIPVFLVGLVVTLRCFE